MNGGNKQWLDKHQNGHLKEIEDIITPIMITLSRTQSQPQPQEQTPSNVEEAINLNFIIIIFKIL